MTQTLEDLTVDRAKLEASVCRDSFYEFFRRFWPCVPGARPLLLNWHIEYICNELQKVAERVFANQPKQYDLIVNVPPGSTKSSICSVLFPAWVWARMPSASFICGSHTDDLVRDLAGKCRDVMLSEKYRELFPDTELRTENLEELRTTQGGLRLARTPFGRVPTGFHADFQLIDDPVNPKTVLSEADSKTVRDWLLNGLPSRFKEIGVGVTILIMQRLGMNDPTQLLLDRAARDGTPVRHICLPAELEDGENVKPRGLRKRYLDGLLDPVRLSEDKLRPLKSGGDMSNWAYSAQYRQNPIPTTGLLFKAGLLEVAPATPPRGDFVRKCRAWDKAATAGAGCYSVGVLIAQHRNGSFWVLDVKRGQWAVEEREANIKQTAQLDRMAWGHVVIKIEEEGGSGGKESSENTVRSLAGFPAEAVSPKGKNKVSRAEALAAQVNIGNVKLAPGPWNSAFVEEAAMFPHGDYLDQIDSASLAFNSLTKVVRVGAL